MSLTMLTPVKLTILIQCIFTSRQQTCSSKKEKRSNILNFRHDLTQDMIQAMVLRDKFKREKLFDLYKKQRNRVSTLVRTAKKNHFDILVTDNGDTTTI